MGFDPARSVAATVWDFVPFYTRPAHFAKEILPSNRARAVSLSFDTVYNSHVMKLGGWMIVSFFIEIVTQDGEMKRVPLQHGQLIVGRSARSSAIVLDDPRVSRVHLQIARDFDQGVMVTDLRSANGTTLDGNPLPPNAPTPWALGQIIGVGQTQLILKYGSIENSTDTPTEVESNGDAPTISD